VTITRTGKPGRIVRVGWMARERPTTCSPTWLKACDLPCWIAAASEPLLLPLTPASQPTLSRVESIAALNHHAPMVVDLVLEPGIPRGVGCWLALEHDRAAAGHDQARPGQQHAALAEGHLGVVQRSVAASASST
jgi:hypothetical protein